jgi:hemoglobin
MLMKKLFTTLAIVIGSLSAGSATADDSLYQSFGQKAGLTALMEDFVPRLLKDPRMEPFFAKTNQQNFKEQLINQMCQVTGGPCIYKGVDMKTVHRDHDITKGNFNALVEVLQESMDAQKIPFRAQNKLLALLAPMHRDVITVK